MRSRAIGGRWSRVRVRGDISTEDFVDRLVVVGDPEFSGIAGSEPEIVIAGRGSGEESANAFAVIIAEIGHALEGAERADAGGGGGDGDVGDVDARDVGPDLASDRAAGVDDLQI